MVARKTVSRGTKVCLYTCDICSYLYYIWRFLLLNKSVIELKLFMRTNTAAQNTNLFSQPKLYYYTMMLGMIRIFCMLL